MSKNVDFEITKIQANPYYKGVCHVALAQERFV